MEQGVDLGLDDDSIHQLMYRVINEPPPPITTGDVPTALDALLQRAPA
jgi:hypothetical protein